MIKNPSSSYLEIKESEIKTIQLCYYTPTNTNCHIYVNESGVIVAGDVNKLSKRYRGVVD